MADKGFDQLILTLRDRFLKNMNRHKGVDWESVLSRLEGSDDKLMSLFQMEQTGGEPDIVSMDTESEVFTFYDCSPESPAGRRSLCYDQKALESRKENKPGGSAVGRAAEMGIELLDEADYRMLQETGEFDRKTSSWIKTPDDIRTLGGAVFCDRRYNHVFLYHNGAESYYAVRGFRGKLLV